MERRENILGYVTRGGESENGIGVGVAVEVVIARVKSFVKNVGWAVLLACVGLVGCAGHRLVTPVFGGPF